MMEYMACGKPVIASLASGHRDILTVHNSIPLKRLRPFELRNGSGKIEALWDDPDLDEVIESLEHAYQHRNVLKTLGKQAGEDMKTWTWEHMASDLLHKLGIEASSKANPPV
jgi:hypothetical protein